MPKTFRRALWGYRRHDTDLYLKAMEADIAERQAAREAQLRERKEQIRRADLDALQAIQSLRSIQAEYFHLAGEMAQIRSRPEELFSQARMALQAKDAQWQQSIEGQEQHNNTLRNAIATVPEQIQAVIQHVTDVMNHSGSSAESSRDPNLASASTHEEASHG